MADDETPSGNPEEPSTTTTEASAGPSGAEIEQRETEQEQQSEQSGTRQAGGGNTNPPALSAPTTGPAAQPSMAARAIGLSSYNDDVRRVAGWTLTCLIVGLIIAAVGAWQNMTSAVLWAAACSAIGWILGFLFGIPRTLQTEGQAEVTQTERETPPDNTTRRVTARRTTGINTNLEQISD